MLKLLLQPRLLSPRLFSSPPPAHFSAAPSAATAASTPSSSAPAPPAVLRPYFVPRNSHGALPVYTDIRNGRTKHLTLIRNIQGNIHALAADLSRELFPPDAPELARMRIYTVRSKHLSLVGGRWKKEVMQWLAARGF